ncbi:hypothetical protein [Aquabacterium sp.]|uniref:hypothetical protein n=1 Tax=Aquabacterium sp. TaxID=1872578 RepID=UPI0037838118
MSNQRSYFVEMRNASGCGLGTHVMAHSCYEAMQLAAERNPGFRPLSARLA